MKIPMKKILSILAIIMLISCTSYAKPRPKENEQAYTKTYQKILKDMDKGMMKAPKTGDITIDFLYEMMAHHKGAIAMAENEVAHGDNPIIWQLARSIKKAQSSQSQSMEKLIRELKEQKVVDKEKEAEYLLKYEKIVEEMMQGMASAQCSENVDKAFLLQMIPHHKGAIAMAENILQYTQNIQVQEMAKKIVEKQTREIKQMEKLAREIR